MMSCLEDAEDGKDETVEKNPDTNRHQHQHQNDSIPVTSLWWHGQHYDASMAPLSFADFST